MSERYEFAYSVLLPISIVHQPMTASQPAQHAYTSCIIIIAISHSPSHVAFAGSDRIHLRTYSYLNYKYWNWALMSDTARNG